MLAKKNSLLSFIIVAVVFSGTCAFERLGPNKEGQNSKELELLWSDVPTYPGMVTTSNYSSSGGRNAFKGTHYRSNAAYDDVKGFFMQSLQTRGWVFKSEKSLRDWGTDYGGKEIRWLHGAYELTIEYAGRRNEDWDYAVSIAWVQK